MDTHFIGVNCRLCGLHFGDRHSLIHHRAKSHLTGKGDKIWSNENAPWIKDNGNIDLKLKETYDMNLLLIKESQDKQFYQRIIISQFQIILLLMNLNISFKSCIWIHIYFGIMRQKTIDILNLTTIQKFLISLFTSRREEILKKLKKNFRK